MNRSEPVGFHCIKIKNITVNAGNEVILDNVNLHIHCGRLTVIIGKNGAGKSTLLKAILGETAHNGTIECKDHDGKAVNNLKIGYVPQVLNIDKNSATSVYDLMASFESRVPVFFKKSKKAYNNALKQLTRFGAQSLIDKNISALSGGELQRVMLSIATAPPPDLLILDEPVSGIDRNGIADFYEIVSSLKTKFDMAIILVSHDLDFVAKYADDVILLDKTVLCSGSVSDVYNSKEFAQTFGETFILRSADKNANRL